MENRAGIRANSAPEVVIFFITGGHKSYQGWSPFLLQVVTNLTKGGHHFYYRWSQILQGVVTIFTTGGHNSYQGVVLIFITISLRIVF